MKIAFYLSNANCHTDCTQIEKGNPGIGGTEYEITAISYFLTTKYKSIHSIFVLAENTSLLPPKMNVLKVQNYKDAYTIALQNGIKCLIIQNSPITNNIVKLEEIHNGGLKLIIWAHSFMSRQQLNLYASSKNVIQIVCVGHEERLLFLDHKAYKKSIVIFNGFSTDINKNFFIPFQERKKEVTFLASIVPHTNFHILAKAWKEITNIFPDAHLNVIGSGNLYNKNTKLGKWGIAEENYEKVFMPYLLDKNGKILSSVTFYGKMGNEKYEILGKTKVGVPNPGGYETFCISALEMQLYGSLVTTIQKGGFIDTVYNRDHLYHSTNQLTSYIVKLLNETDNDYNKFLLFFDKNFSFKEICKQWNTLFDNIENGLPYIKTEYKPAYPNKWYYFSKCNKVLKDFIPLGYKILPSTLFIKTVIKKLKFDI
ncbi:glycosyltransferase [Coprobacter fastidiosus]|uniref:glycosyltransferase n=1 Tax=Coprobacter fastidiosus TaxID=1099853 RepID=UPI00267028DB|nr:glycosyltransferase [Coprobacter fastidiosus]